MRMANGNGQTIRRINLQRFFYLQHGSNHGLHLTLVG
jgi:hypothetical protein